MHLRRTALLAATLLTGLTRAACADSVDDYLKAQMAARHIPGLSVTVVQDGKVVKTAAYGLSDVNAKTPATADTRFILGSCTKPFTAVAVLQLMEAGKVDLDAPISRYLDSLPAAWSAITVRELLTHTSGLPNYRKFVDYTKLSDPKYNQHGSVIALLADKPLDFAPGTKYEYSNSNYHLLAQLIEKLSEQTYEDYLASKEFQAAGMTATHLATLPALLPNQAVGYNWDGKKRRPNTTFLPRALDYGDDGLVSTTGDLAKWTTALSTGQLISEATLKQMITPGRLPDSTPTSYGLGLDVVPYHGQVLAWHNGATPGYSSQINYYVDSHLAVVILCNLYDRAPLTDLMASGVANHYLPAVPVPAAIPDTEPQVAALVRTVAAQFVSGKVDKSLFEPEYYRRVYTPATITSFRTALAPLGSLSSLALLRRDPNGIAVYRALYGTRAIAWIVAVNKEGKITALGYQEME